MRVFGVVVAALVWQSLAWAGAATAVDTDRPRQVLLLYAESRLLPGLVEAHGGRIRAECNGDGGLSVRVQIPSGAGP